MELPGRLRVLTIVTTGVAFSSLFLAGAAVLETKRLLPTLSAPQAVTIPAEKAEKISSHKGSVGHL